MLVVVFDHKRGDAVCQRRAEAESSKRVEITSAEPGAPIGASIQIDSEGHAVAQDLWRNLRAAVLEHFPGAR